MKGHVQKIAHDQYGSLVWLLVHFLFPLRLSFEHLLLNLLSIMKKIEAELDDIIRLVWATQLEQWI